MSAHNYGKACLTTLMIAILAYAGSPRERPVERLSLLRDRSLAHHHLSEIDQAFLDAAKLLEQDGRCAGFYGEPKSSIRVLSELIERIHPEPMPDISTGMRMSGSFTRHVDAETGVVYRLFQQVKINVNGPFYRTRSFAEDRNAPNVGSFPPNTREARVLMLLHELAHLLANRDGPWLIPDDGDDPSLSEKNTLTVERRCREQIKTINPRR